MQFKKYTVPGVKNIVLITWIKLQKIFFLCKMYNYMNLSLIRDSTLWKHLIKLNHIFIIS